MTVRWHRECEMLIRDSGVDYTVVRPVNLNDDPVAAETGDKLLLASDSWEENEEPPVSTGISRQDVANLICLALVDSRCSKATLRVARADPPSASNNYSEDTRAATDWEALLPTVKSDTREMAEFDHGTPVVIVATAILSALLGFLLTLARYFLGLVGLLPP
eukprot:CAMPEP_0184310962 /NCGR_PEP_ID=MMETSP1049-20130417/37011_1 /TAXON_ID=77928 /ORGANISM="Proteomonas sulcata, Strain CCMP704" /LENGTH=161 /DNA_ID=CAMNT_0026625857 /DNA_START=66 /DNA_END=551 /DNA_ORIENTATION=+